MNRKIYAFSLILALGLLFQACAPRSGTGVPVAKRGDVTGTWILNNITYEGVPESAIQRLFGEQAPKCFVGSTWTFTNSGNGTYALPGGNGCSAVTQRIFWSVSPADETFQFKKLAEGQKAAQVTDGYRLVLSSATGENLVLRSPVEAGSGSAFAVMSFSKAGK